MKIYENSSPELILVPTPIGNLGDITKRAVSVLSDSDIIFCEDTRRAKKLLSHLGIEKKTRSLHGYNESRRINEVIEILRSGKKVAYISDSGTPGISDPGSSLVRKAHEHGFAVSALPGACAIIPAVVVSGLRCDKFVFLGFAPASPKNRKRLLRNIEELQYSLVFYESPHRLMRFLIDCINILGDRNCALIKEISKIHEKVLKGKISEIVSFYNSKEIRGEYVIIVEGKGKLTTDN